MKKNTVIAMLLLCLAVAMLGGCGSKDEDNGLDTDGVGTEDQELEEEGDETDAGAEVDERETAEPTTGVIGIENGAFTASAAQVVNRISELSNDEITLLGDSPVGEDKKMYTYAIEDSVEFYILQDVETGYVSEIYTYVDPYKLANPDDTLRMYVGYLAEILAPELQQTDYSSLTKDGSIVGLQNISYSCLTTAGSSYSFSIFAK